MLTKKHLYEDWPTPISLYREKEGRAQLEQDTKEYLKNGGKVTKLPPQSSGKYALFNRD